MSKFDLEFDVDKLVGEFKQYLARKRASLVDYGYTNVECWPPPDSDVYPGIRKLSARMKETFDDEKLSDEEFKKAWGMLDAGLKEIEDVINGDEEFWKETRAEIIPLYDRSPQYEQWKKRWRAVRLVYDPFDVPVKTTMRMKDKEGNLVEGSSKVITDKVIPAGFVLKIL